MPPRALHVLFCGREFPSAPANVARILAPHKHIRVSSCEQVDIPKVLPTADVAVPLMSRLTREVLVEAATRGRLRHIQQWGVGLEGVDMDAAKQLTLTVDNTPSTSAGSRSTAEMAVQLLLCGLRITPAPPPPPLAWGDPRGKSLSGKTVAIVGAHGKLGSSLAEMLAFGFGCKILPIARGTPLLGALQAHGGVDALVLACPLTAETRGMVNDSVLAHLPDDAVLVNVARGPLVDRRALEANLSRLVYATDVWFEEPPRPDYDDELRNHPRVIARQHVGGVSVESGALNDEACARKILALANDRAEAPPLPPSFHEFSPHHVQPTLQTRPSSKTIAALKERLASGVFRDRASLLSSSASELEAHGKDESLHPTVSPDLVASPESTADVVACVDEARRLGVPIVPFGAGTSLEGGVAALAGGLCLDLKRMNRVLSTSTEDMTCRVEAGVTRLQLQRELKPSGLFFPVDPGADATIGGMCATRASGTTTVRWGTMRDRVQGLTAVLADGSVIRSGGAFVKSSAGYDLTAVLLGSEGTLGIITEAQLKLVPVPEAYRVVACSFGSVVDAVNAVVEVRLKGAVGLSRAELLDAATVDAMQKRGQALWLKPSLPCLLMEMAGTRQSCAEDAARAREACAEAVMIEEAEDEAQRSKLWAARHHAYYSALALRPGARGWPTDVCVPLSRLASVVDATVADLKDMGLIAPLFGHVGDGNFHVILLHHPDDGAKGMDKLQHFNARLVERALAAGGTCTGEHGIGFGKMGWLQKEIGPNGVKAMQRIKFALDPFGLLNPGKIV